MADEVTQANQQCWLRISLEQTIFFIYFLRSKYFRTNEIDKQLALSVGEVNAKSNFY